jgi:hypothetical protein
MFKSRRMRQAGHVARVGEARNAYRILWESQKERDHWEEEKEEEVGGMITLKRILEK